MRFVMLAAFLAACGGGDDDTWDQPAEITPEHYADPTDVGAWSDWEADVEIAALASCGDFVVVTIGEGGGGHPIVLEAAGAAHVDGDSIVVGDTATRTDDLAVLLDVVADCTR